MRKLTCDVILALSLDRMNCLLARGDLKRDNMGLIILGGLCNSYSQNQYKYNLGIITHIFNWVYRT